jgi:hypothetical protein
VIVLAAAAHLVGGGMVTPVSPGFVAVSLLSLGACAVLSHREWTLVRLLVCLTGSQVVFHVVLEVERDAAGLRWLVRHAELRGSVDVVPSMAMPGHPAAMMPLSPIPMVLAHAAAVLSSAVLLRSGERLLLRLVELLAGLVPRFETSVRPGVRADVAPRSVGGRGVTLRTQTRLTSLRRRGPPRAVGLTAWSILPAAASLASP